MSFKPFSLVAKWMMPSGVSPAVGRRIATSGAAKGTQVVVTGHDPVRLGKIADAAVLCLSDASRWVTGTTLVMGGGAI